jgi:four helix bundle protein
MRKVNQEVKYDVSFENHKAVIKEEPQKYVVNLNKRLLTFAVEIIRFLPQIPNKSEFNVIKNQLSKSATSIGANYEESQAGSYAEFKQRIQICLREARETHYWLKLIERLNIKKEKNYLAELSKLLSEANEIKLIFGAISTKVAKKED